MKTNKSQKAYCVSVSVSVPLAILAQIEEYALLKHRGKRSNAITTLIEKGIIKVKEEIANDELKDILHNEKLKESKLKESKE